MCILYVRRCVFCILWTILGLLIATRFSISKKFPLFIECSPSLWPWSAISWWLHNSDFYKCSDVMPNYGTRNSKPIRDGHFAVWIDFVLILRQNRFSVSTAAIMFGKHTIFASGMLKSHQCEGLFTFGTRSRAKETTALTVSLYWVHSLTMDKHYTMPD